MLGPNVPGRREGVFYALATRVEVVLRCHGVGLEQVGVGLVPAQQNRFLQRGTPLNRRHVAPPPHVSEPRDV